jgi:hypothetical protein
MIRRETLTGGEKGLQRRVIKRRLAAAGSARHPLDRRWEAHFPNRVAPLLTATGACVGLAVRNMT